MMESHKPILKGSTYVCLDCKRFLFDIRTPARLRALTNIDQVKLAAVINRISSDPDLAERLTKEDPREVIATYKFADKFNDFLMNPEARPDLQTPEAQQFLQTLKKLHNPKTDALMPWLAREWKKGRILHNRGPQYNDLRFDGGPEYEHDGGRFHQLRQEELEHWADWYNSDHPSRQGVDIMQMKSPELHQTIKDWDADMREKAGGVAQTRGNILHTYPDGWTVQQLTDPKQLEDEGEKMGHCVGSYAPAVEQGHSLIYSLRDHQNEPHATWEIRPNRWEDGSGKFWNGYEPDGIPSNAVPVPHEGTIEQIQGKGNKPPIEAYQKRIKDYFENTMPDPKDRPTWEDQHYDDPECLIDPDDGGYIAYHPGDYGLEKPKTTYEWPLMVRRAIDEAGGGKPYAVNPTDLTKKAVEHGQFSQYARAAEEAIEERRRKEEEEYQPLSETAETANYLDELEVKIAAQKRREREQAQGNQRPTASTVRKCLHAHFSTGEPCYCTFFKNTEPRWHIADTTMVCEACGDPLVHGKCRRCDWGGWSNAMTDGEPIADVTKEIKPTVQA